MTSFRIDQLRPRASARDDRVLRFTRDEAYDQLGGRTVWCAGPTPGEDPVERLDVVAGEPLTQLAARLDAMLTGAAADTQLGPAERELCAQALDALDPRVSRDDIVVLHDALTVLLAQAARERGAHTVWLLHVAGPARRPAVHRAWRFMDPFASAVDAYVASHGRTAAALMPSPDVLSVKAGADPGLEWNALLADVVASDRGQTVGGTMHVRPAVAAR